MPQWIPQATRSAKETPQGLANCHKDTHRCQQAQLDTVALGKAPGHKKHVQTARGRVPAAGDVDPAAGSRDEPTRLHVEDPVAKRKQAFEVQVTRAVFLKSINWVQALTPTP